MAATFPIEDRPAGGAVIHSIYFAPSVFCCIQQLPVLCPLFHARHALIIALHLSCTFDLFDLLSLLCFLLGLSSRVSFCCCFFVVHTPFVPLRICCSYTHTHSRTLPMQYCIIVDLYTCRPLYRHCHCRSLISLSLFLST